MSISTNDIKNLPQDKKEIITMAFSRSIHVLRSLYLELIGNIKDVTKRKDLSEKLDGVMPSMDPGGAKVILNSKEYSMMYEPIDYKTYNLDKEVNKIGLTSLSPIETQSFLRELDILASAIPSVNNKYIERDDFKELIKQIFDIFDTEYPPSRTEELKDIDLRVCQNQRFYHMSDDDNSLCFGIKVTEIPS